MITKISGVCGGAACIENTHIPVWLIARMIEDDKNPDKILEAFPSLTKDNLREACEYIIFNFDEITQEILENETA